MVKILMSGCNGRMGQFITKMASTNKHLEITCGLDLYDGIQNTYPVYNNVNDIKEDFDIIIDFTNPKALDSLLEFAISKNKGIVYSTTGLNKDQIQKLKDASSKIPVFYSANMSLGVNLLIDLVKKAAKLLEDNFDIEIIEKHHNQKLDAPSGTALAIADSINEALKDPQEYVYDRHLKNEKRSKKEIGIHAVRGGTIVGDHSVIFAGNNEIIEINHTATSREVFAVGAIKAAIFLNGKEPQMYNMNDLISSFQ